METGGIIQICRRPFSQIRSSITRAVEWVILSKFGVEIDLDTAKRVLSLKPKPGVDFQLYGRNFEKLKNRYDVLTLP